MFPSDDCDDCLPDYLRPRSRGFFTYALFILTFVSCALISLRTILPRLAADRTNARSPLKEHYDAPPLPVHNLDLEPTTPQWRRYAIRLSAKRIVAAAFAANIALSAVLVELLLCEILNALDPRARSFALRLTIPSLMALLILVSPALLIQSVLAALGLTFAASGRRRVRVAWLMETAGVLIWLFAFWSIGHFILKGYLRAGEDSLSQRFLEGCLERIGIIGVTLMASLSGFAAVSAVWQTWLVKNRVVTDMDIIRRQTALDAAVEMLKSKRSRLRALERRVSEPTSHGILSAVAGAFGGSGVSNERSTLVMEITGLESMKLALNSAIYVLHARKAEQERAHTTKGRLLVAVAYVFSIYCGFRLCSASVAFVRRSILPQDLLHVKATTDPVTSVQALLVKHWDPTIRPGAWTRQISFLLSGIMLLASFNSALQTFLLLSRAFPSLASSAAAFRNATTLALLISDVVATYVISSAILLRGNLPSDVGNVISVALSAPLDPRRVDAWFESWFLGSALLTVAGIWIVKKIREGIEDDGVEGDVEMGKRN